MKFLCFALLTLFIVVNPAVAEDYTAGSLDAALSSASDKEATVAVCRDFLKNASEIDVRRSAQDSWGEIDEDSVRAFCNDRVNANPKSAEWAYLAGRVAETPLKQIEFGRLAIKLDKKWPYGYRLLCATYVNKVINGDPLAEDYASLNAELSKDKKAFQQVAELAPDKDWAQDFYYGYLIYAKEFKEALKLLEQNKARGSEFASKRRFADVLARLGEFDKARQLVFTAAAEEMNAAIANGYIEADQVDQEKARLEINQFADLLATAGQNEYLSKWLKDLPDATTDRYILYQIALVEAATGHSDAAFDYLNKSAGVGFDEVGTLFRADELTSLQSDSRWNAAVEAVKVNWAASAAKRKDAVIAKKFSRPAPDWTLKDDEGNDVHLAELKGKVLVLDFWATWCNPCRMSMPVIDRYVKTAMPEGVRVFSVNTWENNPEKAIAFMKEMGYAMELVFGNNDVAKAYGISGIPYICAIDRDGNIRFEAKGFSDGLEEELVWWTEYLLAE